MHADISQNAKEDHERDRDPGFGFHQHMHRKVPYPLSTTLSENRFTLFGVVL
jgi:hypothetical protein